MSRIPELTLAFASSIILGILIGACLHMPVAERIQDRIVAGEAPQPLLRLDNEPEWATSWHYDFSTADGITEPFDIQPAFGYREYQPTFNPISTNPQTDDWNFVGVR